MISIKALHGQDAWRYLMESVTDGQGDLRDTDAITRYYTEAGTPPGRWLGSGLSGLANGAGLAAGSLVTGEQMDLLFGHGHDPVTGQRLGRGFRHPPSYAERVAARVRALPRRLSPQEKAEAVQTIQREERFRKIARPVVGFDYVFTVPKSVSVLWAVADQPTREQITAAHHDAVADIVHLLERDVARTRVGTDGVAQVHVRGMVAAAFDHYDSREHDPNLHTHVVVANRVQTEDGRWRTLDSQGVIFPSGVALSETYDTLVADHLARRLGVGWEVREQGRKLKNARWEITGVPDELIEHFSQRSTTIEKAADKLIAKYRERAGREPDDATKLRLRQQATIDTRREKTHYPLATLASWWRHRATTVLQLDNAGELVARVTNREARQSAQRVDDFAGPHTDVLADEVLARLHETRSTWSRWNIHAEAARATMKYRLASPADPRIDPDQVERLLTALAPDGAPLGEDQSTVVHAVATSGRQLDLLVGPAGSGKTTALDALRAVWEAQHGTGSVIGLAPTAKAADVLAQTLGVTTENTAKWLAEHANNTDRRSRLRQLMNNAGPAHRTGNVRRAAAAAAAAKAIRTQISRWELRPGQLVVVDEASMCGTLALDRLAQQARHAGAKLLLVGDWAQLSAVESGGAFRMLVNDRADTPELSTVRRFHQRWERTASVQLRVGDTRAIDAYHTNGRIRGGAATDMIDAAYAAWAADERAGLASLLIAGTNAAVAEFNTRARADRIAWRLVEPDGHRLHDGTLAGVGDRIVTRQIDRTLRTGPQSWVKNGDQWIVVRRFTDGSLAVRRIGHPPTGKVLTLPASYVAAHVELAYATTAYRAQGDTVDTAHALVRPEMSREVLYVAMTRARQANTAYVCTDTAIDDEYGADQEQPTMREVLDQVLARTGAELSAHETIHAEQERVGSIAQLAAEYDTIAREARRQRWTALAQASFPHADPAQLAQSDAWPGLITAWQRAEATGHNLDTALPRLAKGLPDTGDPVTVLSERVHRWCDHAAPAATQARTLIAGLIPPASYVADPETRQALAERAALIEQRAEALLARAIAAGEPWLSRLGPPPHDPALRLQWEHTASTVAAYRDRHGVTDPADPYGEPRGGGQWTRRADRQRAQAAVALARRLATTPRGHPARDDLHGRQRLELHP